MEYRFEMIKKIALILLALFALKACGYIEKDGIKSRKKIVGNLYLQQFENSDKLILVLKEIETNSSSYVVSNCNVVYFDSLDNVIYVERIDKVETSTYYRIIIKDSLSENTLKAVNKEIINERTFKRGSTKNGSVKVTID